MRYLVAILCYIALFLSCNPVTERLEQYAVHGIDVSHYQAHIDWEKVANQDVYFAFVKATEGKSLTDSLFQRNWREMKRVGIYRGVYHFFRPTISALKQANHFIETVELEIGDLPPVLDIEVMDGVSQELLISRLKIWLKAIEREYSIKPIIYTNLNFYNEHLAGYFDDYPLWIARYSKEAPRMTRNTDWNFWQYGNRGKLDGIEGYVDFNVFKNNREDLVKMTLSPFSTDASASFYR